MKFVNKEVLQCIIRKMYLFLYFILLCKDNITISRIRIFNFINILLIHQRNYLFRKFYSDGYSCETWKNVDREYIIKEIMTLCIQMRKCIYSHTRGITRGNYQKFMHIQY